MTILLLGRNGQLGIALEQHLAPFGQIAALDRSQADLAHPDKLSQVLELYSPSIIVNAAAYTAVDKAESDPEMAYKVNAEAVSVLTEFSKIHSALLIHYSTDYVFDGKHPNHYLETDLTRPLNVYGASKLAGEQAILTTQAPAIIFRTTWLYSHTGNNFMKTIFRLAKERDSLNVIADQIGAPTSTRLVAEITALAIRLYQTSDFAPGLYHLTASGETHWCDFARAIVRGATSRGFSTRLQPKHINAIPSTEYPTPTKRPKNSRLDTTKLRNTLGGITLPDWKSELNLVLDEYCKLESNIHEKAIV